MSILRLLLDFTTAIALFIALVGFFSHDWEHMYIPGYMFLATAVLYAIVGEDKKRRKKK